MSWSVTRAGHNSGATTVSSFTVSITAATTQGDLLVVTVGCCNVGDTTDVKSITDTKGNTYTAGVHTVDPGQNTLTSVWYCPNATALTTSDSLTITLNSALLTFGQFWSATVDDVSGAATASVTDGSQGKNSQTGATWNTGTGITTANATDLLWAAFCTNQGLAAAVVNADCSPTSGWTTLTQVTSGSNGQGSAWNGVSATGTYYGGGTATATNNGTSAVIIAFKAASGGSTVNGSATLVGQGVLENATDTVVGQGVVTDSTNVIIATGLTLVSSSELRVREVFEVGQGVLSDTADTLIANGQALQANAGLTVAAIVITYADTAVGQGVVTEAAQLDTQATFQGNAVESLPDAQVVAGATFQGNSSLSAANITAVIGNGVLTVAAQVLAAASLPAASVLNAAATLLANLTEVGNASIAEAAVIDAGATLQGNSGMQAPNTTGASLIANAVLTATATVLSQASMQAAGVLDVVAARVQAAPAFVGNSILLAVKVWPPLSIAVSLVQKLAATFAPTLKLSAAFARSVSVANPNSTITVTMTVKDNTGALQSNLSAVSVTVTFPDGTTSTFSLSGSTVTNLGSGQYSITYTTKGIGECLEDWTFTASDGVTKGDFHNVTPVSY